MTEVWNCETRKSGTTTLAQLAANPSLKGQSLGGLAQAVAFIVSSGQAHPVVAGADTAAARRLNAVITRRAIGGAEYAYLAAAGLGSALGANALQMAAWQEAATGGGDTAPAAEVIAPKIWAALRRAGRSIPKDGKPISDDAAGIEEVGNQIRLFLADTLPVWRRLGL